MTNDHWQAVRDAGLQALREEAEQRFKPTWTSGNTWSDGPPPASALLAKSYQDAFVAGGQWATEQFVKAMEIRGGLPHG